MNRQKQAFEKLYSKSDLQRWWFHDSKDPLIRYLRDRRLRIAVRQLLRLTNTRPDDWNVLVVCGGVGGEGTFLANAGFKSVTVSDFSEQALELCRKRDPRLQTQLLNAESLDVDDEAYDLVLVQDGLHHLTRPALGLTEMLRVAKRAVILIEPHTGIVARLLGTVWEEDEQEINYVFRWNKLLLKQVVSSYVLTRASCIKAIRLWDHNLILRNVAGALGGKRLASVCVKSIYAILNTFFWWMGNMMIGIVIKSTCEEAGVLPPKE